MCIDILFPNILKELHVFCYLGRRIIPTKLIQMTKKKKTKKKKMRIGQGLEEAKEQWQDHQLSISRAKKYVFYWLSNMETYLLPTLILSFVIFELEEIILL
jgi:hypothetical protein